MLVNLDHFPKVRDENKTYLEPPPPSIIPLFLSGGGIGEVGRWAPEILHDLLGNMKDCSFCFSNHCIMPESTV